MRRATRSSGFTLVEVMITLLLFSIVIAGMFSSLIVIGRAQAASARVDVAQSGVRAALDLLTRDLGMASAAATTGTITFATGTPATANAITVTDGAQGPDRLDLVLVDASAQATTLATFAAGQSSLSVDNIANFNVGDSIQLSDLSAAVILTVTAIAGGASPVISVIVPSNPLPRSYPAGSFVFRSRRVSYYIDNTLFGAQGQDPLLMLDPDGAGPLPAQPIAEGIEDLQIALAFDINGDGLIGSVGASANDDEWYFNVTGETAPASLALLRAARVTLIARSTSTVAGLLGRRPAAEDHAGAAVSDGYPRRVLHSEIAVRNFNL